MPTHCCVPECIKKGYRAADGTKVCYLKFPIENPLKKKWLHAIRREEGKFFTVTENTKVCSRHFREGDIKKTLAGKNELRGGVVPSVFPWVRTSPRKRKEPAERNFELIASKSASRKLSVDMEAFGNEMVPDASDSCSNFVNVATQNDFTDRESYLTEIIDNNNKKIHELEQEIEELERRLQDTQRQNDTLNKRLFNFENCRSKDSNAAFYSGFQSWDTFMAVFEYLDPGERGENISYWRSTTGNTSDYSEVQTDESLTKKGRARSLKPIDEFFMVMCRLRQGFPEDHLAHLFNVSTSTVSRIFITWVNFMYFKFGQINIWLSRKLVDATMPESFKIKYKSTRVIIDCTEVKCQMPSSLQLNGELFSSYKNHTTLKGLVGISPGGAVTFISQLYTGSISDREIVRRSGFLELPFDDKDSIMADKGFTIQDLLPLGVTLNLPPFLGASSQMAAEDVVKTQEIASLRIHIERAINKIKNFQIWDRVVPLHQMGMVNQMWAVCAFCCNAQPNIISM
ncbi:uncharacterized protein LOC144660965 [Oculina patagonica]